MKIIRKFINKTLSLLRFGHEWLNNLTTSIIEAARTNSYVETTSPTQSDTLHKEIKNLDNKFLMKEYESFIRQSLKQLKLENQRVKIALDVTEDNTWIKKGIRNIRPSTHKGNHHVDTFQYLNVAIVEPFFLPLMSVPYTRLNNLTNLSIDLLKYAKSLPLKIDLVLFDRGFYIAHLIDYMENRRGGNPTPYLIFAPKTKAVKKYIEQTEFFETFHHIFDYDKDKSTWKPSTKMMIWKPDPEVYPDVVWPFVTNQELDLKTIDSYPKRWGHETGFRVHDEAKIKSKSQYLIIRFFYHLLGMVMVVLWRVQSINDKHVIFKLFLKAAEAKYAELVVCPNPPPKITIY